jgi:hypothetical protein
MVDTSFVPCRHCRHLKNDHGKHFASCFKCADLKQDSFCEFERLPNLEYLEWILRQKGETR